MNPAEIPVFIKGKTIDLLPTNLKHSNLYTKWLNNPETRIYIRNQIPKTLEEIRKLYDSNQGQSREIISLEIWHKQAQQAIGLIGFSNINWIQRNANIYVQIGEIDFWGKGIGTEAVKLMLEYGFLELNLHKIYSNILVPNKSSLKVAERVGFIQEVVLREEIYLDDNFIDNIFITIFKDEWLQKRE
ncbi:MAG: GNAT family N-acetyltransferase [Promethearchaeota archaeon]